MKLERLRTAVVVACALAGCVHAEQYVDPSAAVQGESGYVAGSFDVTSGDATFGFGIVDALGNEYVIPFTDAKGWQEGKRLGMIGLPPGDYRVAYWTYSTMKRDRVDITSTSPLAKPFGVAPGHVVFLGHFAANKRMTSKNYQLYNVWTIEPKPIRADEVWRAVTQAYPSFANAPVECVLCGPPAAGAATFAAPPDPGRGDFSARHDVAIHYYRPDEDYSSTRITAWETFDGKRSVRHVKGATARYPMAPPFTDGFGTYWLFNDLNFKNGRVGFTIRNVRDGTDEQDRTLDLAQSHEVWINAGDPKTYLTQEEAEAAQPKAPDAEDAADDP